MFLSKYKEGEFDFLIAAQQFFVDHTYEKMHARGNATLMCLEMLFGFWMESKTNHRNAFRK